MLKTRIWSPLVIAASLAFAGSAGAQGPVGGAAAACDGVQQDKAACVREAGAARQAAGQGQLSTGSPSSLDANAMARCQQLPAVEQSDCEARLRGSGSSTTSGSVMGGGVIRETVTPVPAK